MSNDTFHVSILIFMNLMNSQSNYFTENGSISLVKLWPEPVLEDHH